MYNENVKKEMEEMKDLLARIRRLDSEAKLYNGEDSKPMLNSIEKLQEEYESKKEDVLARYEVAKNNIKEQFKEKEERLKEDFEKEKNELEEPYNKKIEEINVRIDKLRSEKALYEKDEDYKQSIQNNIDRLEEEIRNLQETEGRRIADILKAKEEEINSRIETTKEKINNKMEVVRKELEEVGISVEPFSLEDKEQLDKDEVNKNEEIDKDEENKNEEIDKDEEIELEDEEEQSNHSGQSQIIHTNAKRQNGYTERVSSEAVRIFYSAKQDKYIVTDLNNNTQKIIRRKDLTGLDKEKVAEKIGKGPEDLMNVDINVLEILSQYDKEKGTSKTSEYLKMMTELGKSKKDRKQEMKDSQIEIEYNLKGLYDKVPGEELDEMDDLYTAEERRELLGIANIAKAKGIATVKKGIKVKARETLDRIVEKIKPSNLLAKRRTLELPEVEDEYIEDEYIEGKTNKEYWKSIDEQEFRKAVRQANDERSLKEKLEMIKAEKDYYELMHPTKYAIDRADTAAKEKIAREDDEER